MLLPCLRLACIALLALPAAVAAGAPAASSPPEARQFDFWVGEWDVTSPDGRRQGASRVERMAGGLLETWTGDPAAGNGAGRSLNVWNAEKRQWQQFWVGSDGTVLELAGGLDACGRMVLRGERARDGARVLEQITWTPNPDGTVEQRWEQSSDDGRTWKVIFEGRYTRKAESPTARAGGGRRALYFLLQ